MPPGAIGARGLMPYDPDIIVLEMEPMADAWLRDRAASFGLAISPGASRSMPLEVSEPTLLLCRRWRFDDAAADRDADDAPGPGVAFGGAAAMGTAPFTPVVPTEEPMFPKWLVGVLPAVLCPDATPPLPGLSTSFALTVRLAGGDAVLCWLVFFAAAAVVDMERVELLREAAAELLAFALFLDREPDPMELLPPDPRFLFLMTSVFKLSGRTTP